ncbi:hypothetical protein [Xanthomonas campestris]|uniref:hypothetical protein n=1 Tax=Xanthomonas campestris TaxID=339 RepID=UPI003CE7CDBE
MRMSIGFCSGIILWIGMPWGLLWASDHLPYGLVWLALHQLYYLPLASWLGSPFFASDNDLSFNALPAGRALTVFFYLLVAALIIIFQRWNVQRSTRGLH